MPILTKGKTGCSQNWGRYLATEKQRGTNESVALNSPRGDPPMHGSSQYTPNCPQTAFFHSSSTGIEPRDSGTLDNCSTTEPHPPDKNAVDKFKLPLRSRYEITATHNNLFLSDNQSKPLLCL